MSVALPTRLATVGTDQKIIKLNTTREGGISGLSLEAPHLWHSHEYGTSARRIAQENKRVLSPAISECGLLFYRVRSRDGDEIQRWHSSAR